MLSGSVFCLAKAVYYLVCSPCVMMCNQTRNRNTLSQLVALLEIVLWTAHMRNIDIVLHVKHGQHTCITSTKSLFYAEHQLSSFYFYLVLGLHMPIYISAIKCHTPEIQQQNDRSALI